MALTLVAGAAFVACGGGNDNKATPTAVENQGGNEATSTPSTGANATPKATADNSGISGGSIGDIPVYPGATNKGDPYDFTGPDANAMIIPIKSVYDASFTRVLTAEFQTSDSAQQVLDWYKDQMSGWTPGEAVDSGIAKAIDSEGWTKDNGKIAAWVNAVTQSGNTTLGIIYATQ